MQSNKKNNNATKINKDFEESKIKDLKNPEVPTCMYWSIDQVCEFFDKLNLPEYKVNFFNLNYYQKSSSQKFS